MAQQSPPISMELEQLSPFIAQVITQELGKSPVYEFNSIGKGLIGGLFNLAGGLFGNDDLGGELFGKKQDNTVSLANLVLQAAGLQQEAEMRKEDRAFQRDMMREMQKYKLDEMKSQHKFEQDQMKLAFELDTVKTMQDQNFQERMRGLSHKQQLDVAKVQNAYETGRMHLLSDLEIKRSFSDATITNALAENGSLRNIAEYAFKHSKDEETRKAAEQFTEKMQKDQQAFQAGESEKNRQAAKEQATADREAQVGMAKEANQTRIKGALIEAGSRETAAAAGVEEAKIRAQGEQQKSQQADAEKRTKESVNRQGRQRALLDAVNLQIEEQYDGQGNDFAHPKSPFSLLQLSNSPEAITATGPLPKHILGNMRVGLEDIVKTAVLEDPDITEKELNDIVSKRLNNAAARTKEGIMSYRKVDPVSGKTEDTVDDETYAMTESALEKLRSNALQILPGVVSGIHQMNAAEQNYRKAAEMMSGVKKWLWANSQNTMGYNKAFAWYNQNGAQEASRLQEAFAKIKPPSLDQTPTEYFEANADKIGPLVAETNVIFGDGNRLSAQIASILSGN